MSDHTPEQRAELAIRLAKRNGTWFALLTDTLNPNGPLVNRSSTKDAMRLIRGDSNPWFYTPV